MADFKIDNTRNSKTWISGLNSISSSPANRRTFTLLSFLQHLLASTPSAPAANRSSSNCSPWRLKKQKSVKVSRLQSFQTCTVCTWQFRWWPFWINFSGWLNDLSKAVCKGQKGHIESPVRQPTIATSPYSWIPQLQKKCHDFHLLQFIWILEKNTTPEISRQFVGWLVVYIFPFRYLKIEFQWFKRLWSHPKSIGNAQTCRSGWSGLLQRTSWKRRRLPKSCWGERWKGV